MEIFSDSSDQCETYEGKTVADNDGYWQFDGVVSGPNVKASATDSNGNTSELSHNHVVTHSPEDPRIENPDEFCLYQNYPNPFNPVTTIEFSVQSPCMVNLDVYNILGQKVAVLVNKKKQAGFYRVSWNSTGMSAGVYIYQIVMGEHYQFRRKMLLLE